ncbi:MAG: hypothetical protein Kow0029_03920 [Candidatus Rifleibacteriota bacterium]
MIAARRNVGLISLLLIFSLLLTPFVDAAELSLFQKLKLKTQNKIEEFQQKDWWITKAVSKVVGFAAGKAGGAVGAGVGYLLGAAVGGPLAAGLGAWLGFKIGDIVTKTFARAVSEVVTQRKLKEGKPVTVKGVIDVLKSVNKASLTAESVGAVIGDLIGGTMGAAAGIAFLAGTGPIAIPILGTISAAYLGSKLGKAIFGGLGRWIGRKALKKGYEAYAGINSKEVDAAVASTEDTNTESEKIENKNATPDIVPASVINEDARAAYERAYREYTKAITSGASESEKKEKLGAYLDALQRYKSLAPAIKTGN